MLAAAALLASRPVVLHDRRADCVPYERALSWQRALHAERAAQLLPRGEQPARQLDDALILLQHPPTYTLGSTSTLSNVVDPAFDLVRTERGGEVRPLARARAPCARESLALPRRPAQVTYHGPGQLVMYPLLNLRHYQQDIHWYMRSLEEARPCSGGRHVEAA